MSFDIGPRIGIEGDKAYKDSIRDINNGMRVLKSEMLAVTSAFDKNEKSVESLTARSGVLNKQVEQQKHRISELRAALQNSADTYGENDKATQEWQVRLNRAVAELNKMEKESEEVNADLHAMKYGLDQSGDSAEKAGGKFEKFGGVLKGMAVAAGAAVAAAGAAAVKLGKEVVSAYADYEQLVGGVDTLFGGASQTVQKYADNAYKTAGLSANAYMETVTGFSASLIQSLGGDTAKAVQVADMAVTDMADNANKMGTDIGSIQNAYQGFAKQNYTMLDNLKLGYGGTKTEMERLLADAGKISGIKYDLSSFSDLTEAIHVVQTEMGITGTTALEAEETISGSVSGMKSAFSNLIAGLGNANADVVGLTKNLSSAFGAVVKNIVPVIKNLVSALPVAVDALLGAVESLLPELLNVFQALFSQILGTLLKMLPNLIPAIVSTVMTLADTIIANLPLIISAAVALIIALVQGINSALPQLIPAAVDALLTIVEGLIENLPMLIDAAITLVVALTEGILNALPMLLKRAPEIIKTLVNGIVGAIPQLVNAAVEIVMMLVDFLLDPDNIYLLIKGSYEIMAALAVGLIRAIPELMTAIPKIAKRMIEKFKETNWSEIGENILAGIADGLIGGVKSVVDTVKKVAGRIADGFKNFFEIKSPSALMRDDVGKMLGFGMAEGIEASMKRVNSAMSAMNNQVVANAPVSKGSASSETNTVNNYNTYGPARYENVIELDGREVGRAVTTDVSREFEDVSLTRRGAFGTA